MNSHDCAEQEAITRARMTSVHPAVWPSRLRLVVSCMTFRRYSTCEPHSAQLRQAGSKRRAAHAMQSVCAACRLYVATHMCMYPCMCNLFWGVRSRRPMQPHCAPDPEVNYIITDHAHNSSSTYHYDDAAIAVEVTSGELVGCRCTCVQKKTFICKPDQQV